MSQYSLFVGDCLDGLRELPAGAARTCVTSPPYFGLRDYGHEGQIGLEPTPDEFVAALVRAFREVRRVLSSDGTVWLNLGDSYSRAQESNVPQTKHKSCGYPTHAKAGSSDGAVGRGDRPGLRVSSLPPKQLLGIPWRVAFALQADGWYLRQDIIWAKPNPMPESVRDRCTKSHEYLFLLSKSPRYYFDAEAIAEPLAPTSIQRLGQATLEQQEGSGRVPGKANGNMKAVGGAVRPQKARALQIAEEKGLTPEHLAAIRSAGCTDTGKARVTQSGTGKNTEDVQRLAAEAKEALGGYYREFLSSDTRNKRSVWTVTTKPFKGAHFAVFPPDLIEPCVLAGSEPGDLVIDPFTGSGTTGMVAGTHGRKFYGCELNPEYAEMANERIAAAYAQGRLFA